MAKLQVHRFVFVDLVVFKNTRIQNEEANIAARVLEQIKESPRLGASEDGLQHRSDLLEGSVAL